MSHNTKKITATAKSCRGIEVTIKVCHVKRTESKALETKHKQWKIEIRQLTQGKEGQRIRYFRVAF